jgi:predicted house-cleaning noncanonical NTP pyrophosphatase (MazG superfamily)
MKSGVIQSHELEPITWSEAETLIPQYGPKASRLLCLPRAWTPPFVLWPEDLVAKLTTTVEDELAKNAWQSIQELLRDAKEIILRSSITTETIWDRGTYESVQVEKDKNGIDWPSVKEALVRVVNSAGGRKTAVIVQVFFRPLEVGEFGNVLRVSKTRDQWELSARTGGTVYQTDRVNTQRDSAPNVDQPLAVRSGITRERFFGPIGAWVNNSLVRGTTARVNCEWILSDNTFWIVQLDGEDEDYVGINPHQIPIETWPEKNQVRSEFILSPSDADIQRWDKLRVLNELYDANAQNAPRLFLLTCKSVHDKKEEAGFLAQMEGDFMTLFSKNIVIRTSGLASQEKVTNLPRTECLSPAEAVDWCLKAINTFIAEGTSLDGLAFVIHRFIAARASAWARVDPNNPVAEIHGTWGLPDALQFCSYDNWEVHVDRQDVTEYPDYKSHILLASEDGKWRYERVRNDIARHQSISRKDVMDIASRSIEIAKKLGRPMHIMWFVMCAEPGGKEANIPWYWTEAHKTEDHAGRQRPRLLKVHSYDELKQIAEFRPKYSNLAIDLQPRSIDLFRDNKFLKAVSDVAVPSNVPVYLRGSSLSHAYYQLQKNGCTVIPLGDKDHLRVRKQVQFGKLVRDGIPEKIASKKEHAATINVPASIKEAFLFAKFMEELLEVREATTPAERTSELADVFEVLRGLIASTGNNLQNVIEIADRKKLKLGGFDAGAILLETSMPTAQSGEAVINPTDHDLEQIKMVDGETYEIPFTYLGFSPLGNQKVLRLERLGIELVIMLNKDHIRISAQPIPQQMKFDL